MVTDDVETSRRRRESLCGGRDKTISTSINSSVDIKYNDISVIRFCKENALFNTF